MLSKSLIFCLFSFFSFSLPLSCAEEIFFDDQNSVDFNLEKDSDDFELPLQDLELIQIDRMPKHIGFILDGNRRWARQRGLKESEGHSEGAYVVMKILKFLCTHDLGVNTATFYAFSTENWKRSKGEIENLIDLFSSFMDEIFPMMKRYSICLKTIGDLEEFPTDLQEKIQYIKDYPIENPIFTVVVALNYGGRDEIKRACFNMIQDFEKGIFQKEEVSEKLIESYLDTSSIPDPDLIIRTSGETRVSNFLLWQLAYSEFEFSPLLWPDFSKQDLINILLKFQDKERRFGGSK